MWGGGGRGGAAAAATFLHLSNQEKKTNWRPEGGKTWRGDAGPTLLNEGCGAQCGATTPPAGQSVELPGRRCGDGMCRFGCGRTRSKSNQITQQVPFQTKSKTES